MPSGMWEDSPCPGKSTARIEVSGDTRIGARVSKVPQLSSQPCVANIG